VTPTRMQNAPRPAPSPFESLLDGDREVLNERTFQRMLIIERKRTERSKEPFLLTLLEPAGPDGPAIGDEVLDRLASALLTACRETDVIGWYKDRSTIGMIFSGLANGDRNEFQELVRNRVVGTLRELLSPPQADRAQISFHYFPDDWNRSEPGSPVNETLYPDLLKRYRHKRSQLAMKRAIDLTGSALALLILLPLLAGIALAIRATSPGSVLFKQQRVGRYGKLFTFLKFRSMYANNDSAVHKEYVTKLIASAAEKQRTGDGKGIYKLTNDKRITPVGGFLRRTSLDELPQFINVLRGEMSLVGPRPAIPYELEAYQTWHRRRILEAKPGITGLWQVTGRSRVTFDEMVRLDLQYATSWTPWMDLKILVRTPLSVIRGSGAC
jgi:lipopolysaccharide/colanic/teichoic acid biosynthesis glycosyltransferase